MRATGRGTHHLRPMFATLAGRYDLLNRLFTLWFDQRWRRRAANRCLEDSPSRVLDLCCGTGDLALLLAHLSRGTVEVVGLDFSPTMLEVARDKARRSPSASLLQFVEGDGAALAFPDDHFDAVGVAFAFRNVTWRNPLQARVLAEVRRVLRPGGTFVIVETSQPGNGLVRAGFHTYMRLVVGPVGGLVSGNRPAYRYLAESARSYYDADEVGALLTQAGFRLEEVEPLMGGVAAIHVASRA